MIIADDLLPSSSPSQDPLVIWGMPSCLFLEGINESPKPIKQNLSSTVDG